ncbi:MAG: AAA family ATPase [Vicinamibacterales bacterium]
MIVEDQDAVLAFLSKTAAYPGASPAERVERIDTHSATVFLVGDDAYKLKRAVRYEYLDFSTLDRRRRFCEAEVALNRRVAPTLYRGVVPVTRAADGQLTLDGPGTPVEWLVHMRRFNTEDLLDKIAGQGRLSIDQMPQLAQAVARLHALAQPCHGRHGSAVMRWVVDGNARGFRDEGADVLAASLATRVTTTSHDAIAAQAALLDARGKAGWIRHCHGDLHLGNIVMIDGTPVPFDAIEFNDDLACNDVLYDLAFLLMDLWRLDLRAQANALLNEYVTLSFGSEDCAALALLPLFLSCRSAVRAKTSATAHRLQRDPSHSGALAGLARTYLEEADTLLRPHAPALVAIGGFSGSGKTTVARAIADRIGATPGALILRTDVLRKRLAGVPTAARLDPAAYTPARHAQVYDELSTWARAVLAAGHAVIADAVFGDAAERDAIERVAAEARVPFVGLWLDAPAAVLERRVAWRQHDASDATVDVVLKQLARGGGEIRWSRVDASDAAARVVGRVRGILGRVLY